MKKNTTKMPVIIDLVDDSFSKEELEIVDLTKSESEITVLKEIKNVGKFPWLRKDTSTSSAHRKNEIRSNDIQIVNVIADHGYVNHSIYSSASIYSSGSSSPRTTKNSLKAAYQNLPNSTSTRNIDDCKMMFININESESKIFCGSPTKLRKRKACQLQNSPGVGTRSAKKIKRRKSSCTRSKNITTSKSKKKRKSKDTPSNSQGNDPSTPVTHYYETLQKAVLKNRKNKKPSPKKIIKKNINLAQNSSKVEKMKSKKKKKRRSLQRIANSNLTPSRPLSKKLVVEPNLINPNPYEIDKEGLRPVVIDGSNIAVGHGRGKFSPTGIQICVNYFSNIGHKKSEIKVFLPLFRKEEFRNRVLTDLETKCDMIFTPSRTVDGVTRTSYDDRFIIQYAFEVSGVVVSNDNYRDLLKENPLWRETILNRHLMFTWADDVLMFPVDPYGKTGPTLEELLRF